jgi:hypothetical protein
MTTKKLYPSDVSDEGPFFVAPYVTLLPKDEWLPATVAGLHLIAFAVLMLHQWMSLSSP